MDLLLTGRWMDAAEAKGWGLVNEILPANRLLPRAREIARLLADGPQAMRQPPLASTPHLRKIEYGTVFKAT